MFTPPRTGRALGALGASVTTAVVLAATLGVGGASAQPGDQPSDSGDGSGTPTKSQVDHAQQDVRDKARGVAAIRADLGSAQRDLDAASNAAEIASERYNGAVWKLGLARKTQHRADTRAAQAAKAVKSQRSSIARLVVRNFRGGTQMDQLTVMLDADGPNDVLQRYGALHSATVDMDAQYDRYRAALTRSKVAQRQAHSAKKKAVAATRDTKKARDAAAAAATSAEARTSALQARTTQLTRQLAQAQHISVRLAGARAHAIRLAAARAAAAKAARVAAAKAARQAADSPSAGGSGDTGSSSSPGSGSPSTGSGSGDSGDSGPSAPPSGGSGGSGGSGSSPAPSDPGPSKPPSPSGGASAAIAFAKSQIGDPYRWGATGPSSWDCSGLTMAAWAAGGKSIPRNSAMQYGAINHISRSELRPGDLIFWGSSPGGIHHVAMYLGGNQMIHAPRTGQDVKISSVDYWIPPNYFGRP